MKFYKRVLLSELTNEKIEDLSKVNKEIINKAYSLFCIDFVNQLKKDFNFNVALYTDETLFFDFEIDLPRKRKKAVHDHVRNLIKQAQIDPFNTDIKEGVK